MVWYGITVMYAVVGIVWNGVTYGIQLTIIRRRRGDYR
jgi:hypothetical protein